MPKIDLFYQAEGVAQIEHIEVEPDATVAAVKARLVGLQGFAAEALIFVEDEEEPLSDTICVKDRADPTGLKVHIGRCRHVVVEVTFNGETVERRFPPSATIARVKRWAAEREFGMTDDEAGEHVLQLAGTHDRPSPGAHIGTLVAGKACAAAFDLVANERVNGADGGAP
ncbi:hypothetical protein GWK16_06470 [Roseomonas sp. JC162]|uniref:Ubiquitin-like domain-containing protein n=1 Tax=Neoroseomonas marina TaxID=1232220 RepID=A0A848EC41_9PROT|nr:hypothetical protein [Neoroseomonas marina]NMJ40878.1 hypothetical protein [Neoroseomonas marina]